MICQPIDTHHSAGGDDSPFETGPTSSGDDSFTESQPAIIIVCNKSTRVELRMGMPWLTELVVMLTYLSPSTSVDEAKSCNTK